MSIPNKVKIYHIMHIDNLQSVLEKGYFYSDAIVRKKLNIVEVGLNKIKDRRLERQLCSFTNLCVGECVPFYFCPRSIMLYVISKSNHPDLHNKTNQEDILHFQFDVAEVLQWTKKKSLRWLFTLENAGTFYFTEKTDIAELNTLDWNAINARHWSSPEIKEKKQAEFLIEKKLSITLIEKIGVKNTSVQLKVNKILNNYNNILVEVKNSWYY